MALSEVIARLGFTLDDRALKRGQSGISKFTGGLQAFGKVLAGSFIVRGAARFIDDLTKEADNLAKASKQLDVNAQSLQRWQTAAQLSGASAEDVNKGLRILAKRANDVDRGLKTSIESFDALGVEATNVDGSLKDNVALFKETGLALAGLENSTQRTALAQELFGRAGIKLLPVFSQGEEGLQKLLGVVDEFGGALSADLLPLAEETRDNLLKWDLATKTLKSSMAVSLLPALNQIIITVARWAALVGKATQGSSRWQTILIAIAGASFAPLIGALRTLVVAIAPLLIKFALLFLIIDDIQTFFEGGDSLIGKGLEEIFGAGADDTTRDALKDIGSEIKALATNPSWEQLDQTLEKIFGPPGQAIIETFVDAFDTAKTRFIGQLDLARAELVIVFNDLTSKAKQFASDFIDGIVSGIKAGISKVTDTVGDLGDKVTKVLRDKFNWKSPAGLTRELGEDLDLGLIQGIMKGLPNVRRAFNQLAPAPSVTSASVRQSNNINITVPGGTTPVETAQAVGRSVARSTRSELDSAAAALIATN